MTSVFWGASGLSTVSLAAYSVWAFLRNPPGGELGLYALIAAVYLGGSGLVLSGLLHGRRRVVRFYAFFLPAFVLYAVAWTAAWFGLGGKAGEWVGGAPRDATFRGRGLVVPEAALRLLASGTRPLRVAFRRLLRRWARVR